MADEIVVKINTPKNLNEYKGQFVVFFSDEDNPQVLFNSFFAEEAYNKAEEIKKEAGKEPIVYRVQEDKVNIAQVFLR